MRAPATAGHLPDERTTRTLLHARQAKMDAATLYAVITVGSGQKQMTTQKFPTINICEQEAQKLRKKTPMKNAIFYCVKRKPDDSERQAVEAAKRRAMQGKAAAQQQLKQQQPQGAGPIGMPRDFYSGTTPGKQ